MRLTDNAELLNFYINHSEVRPFVAPDEAGYIDTTEIVARPDTYLFATENGCLLFFRGDDSIYRIDAYFPRKSGAIPAILKGLDFIFKTVGARKVIAEAPEFHLACRMLIVSQGFHLIDRKAKAFKKDNKLYDVLIYEKENPNGKHS